MAGIDAGLKGFAGLLVMHPLALTSTTSSPTDSNGQRRAVACVACACLDIRLDRTTSHIHGACLIEINQFHTQTQARRGSRAEAAHHARRPNLTRSKRRQRQAGASRRRLVVCTALHCTAHDGRPGWEQAGGWRARHLAVAATCARPGLLLASEHRDQPGSAVVF